MGYPTQPQGYENSPPEPGSYPQYPEQFGQAYGPDYYDAAPAQGYPPPYGGPVLPAPSPKRSRKGVYAALGVVAILVVVILVLGLVGFLPIPGLSHGTGGSSPPSASPLTLFQAENIANGTVAQQGSGWQLDLAMALQSPNEVNPELNYPCATIGYSPAAGSTVGTGTAYSWGFEYMSSLVAYPYTGGGPIPHGIFVVVSNGSATVTTRLNVWNECPGIEYGQYDVLPSNLASSTAASARALNAGGQTFLNAHSGSSSELMLGDEYINGTYNNPVWFVGYLSPCSAATSNQAMESLTMNATTLAIVTPAQTLTATCTPGPLPTYKVSFTSSGSGSSGNDKVFFDNYSISSTPANLALQNFSIALFEPNRTLIFPGSYPAGCQPGGSGCMGAPVGGEWYATLDVGSQVIAVFPEGSGNSWYFNSNFALSGAITLTIVSTVPLSGSGYTLQAFTWSGVNLSGSVTL